MRRRGIGKTASLLWRIVFAIPVLTGLAGSALPDEQETCPVTDPPVRSQGNVRSEFHRDPYSHDGEHLMERGISGFGRERDRELDWFGEKEAIAGEWPCHEEQNPQQEQQ